MPTLVMCVYLHNDRHGWWVLASSPVPSCYLPLSHAHQNRVEPGLVSLGLTRFYEFRSHAPVSRALCRLVTSVIAKMAVCW